jgi:hypothetical protein
MRRGIAMSAMPAACMSYLSLPSSLILIACLNQAANDEAQLGWPQTCRELEWAPTLPGYLVRNRRDQAGATGKGLSYSGLTLARIMRARSNPARGIWLSRAVFATSPTCLLRRLCDGEPEEVLVEAN